MTTVTVQPMPEKFRSTPKKYQPGTPPIFRDCDPGGPTDEDRQLARELFGILDDESRDWYRRNCPSLFRGV